MATPAAAPWFLGAPVSKAIATSTAVSYVLAETMGFHDDLTLDIDKVLIDGQVHRLFLCHLTFASVGELILGLAVLCPLMRRFEREMGSRKFGTFLFFTTIISTVWEVLLSQVFHEATRYSGPYPQLGCLLLLYHMYTPRLHPHFFGILGFDFSEKALTYGFAFQVLFSGGISTFLPAFCGAIAGYLCITPILPLSKLELPDFVYSLSSTLGGAFVDRSPVILAARRHQRRTGAAPANRQQLIPDARFGAPRPMMNDAPAAQQQFQNAPTPPAPSEEAIEQLTAMGFEREAVIRVLQQCDNNVEVAANRLLSGA